MNAKETFCYWTVATGKYADLVAAMIGSARRVGVTQEFHVWTDRDSIPGAICHPAGAFNNWGWLFKLVFLREEVSKLEFQFTVYLDADNWFVRNPGEMSQLLGAEDFHISLECDLTRPHAVPEWWQYPTETYVELARIGGIAQSSVYSVNGGMFLVRRSAIERVYELVEAFWEICRGNRVFYVDEPLMGYAMQRMCDDPEKHTVAATRQFWATDVYEPDPLRALRGEPFAFYGYLRQDPIIVQPAIVHSVFGKQAMLDFRWDK